MIPILYDKNWENIIGHLADTTVAEVHEARNGIFELTLEMPVSGSHFADIALGSVIAASPSPTRSPEPFEVYEITKELDGMSATIKAQHISYRLSLIPVMPFTNTGLAQNTLNEMAAHAAEDCPFDFWSDIDTTTTYTQTVPASFRNRLMGEQGSVLQTYHGEYEFSGYHVKLLANRGVDRGYEIRYGKNLQSLEQEQSIENTITGILPYWSGMDGDDTDVMWLPEKILRASTAADFPYQRTVCVDFSSDFESKPTEAQLRARGQQYIAQNHIGVPIVSFEASAASLEKALDYQGSALSERLDLCDTVTIIFPAFGIKAQAKVIEIWYDVLKERYKSYHIGDARTTLADTIANQGDTIKSELASDIRNAVQQSASGWQAMWQADLAHATAQINGNLSGASMITQTDSDGNPVGLIFMDTTSTDTAKNCIRINSQGIGFSTQGVGGPFNSAWLISGTMDMQRIKVINLSAQTLSGLQINNGNGTFKVDANGNVTSTSLTSTNAKITNATLTNCSITGGSLQISTSSETTDMVNLKYRDTEFKLGSSGYIRCLEHADSGARERETQICARHIKIWDYGKERVQLTVNDYSVNLRMYGELKTESTQNEFFSLGVTGSDGSKVDKGGVTLQLRNGNKNSSKSGIQITSRETGQSSSYEWRQYIANISISDTASHSIYLYGNGIYFVDTSTSKMRVKLTNAGLYFYNSSGTLTKTYAAT